MSNNDRTKWDLFFEMGITEFLNTVAFYKDKAQHEKQEMDKIRKKW